MAFGESVSLDRGLRHFSGFAVWERLNGLRALVAQGTLCETRLRTSPLHWKAAIMMNEAQRTLFTKLRADLLKSGRQCGLQSVKSLRVRKIFKYSMVGEVKRDVRKRLGNWNHVLAECVRYAGFIHDVRIFAGKVNHYNLRAENKTKMSWMTMLSSQMSSTRRQRRSDSLQALRIAADTGENSALNGIITTTRSGSRDISGTLSTFGENVMRRSAVRDAPKNPPSGDPFGAKRHRCRCKKVQAAD